VARTMWRGWPRRSVRRDAEARMVVESPPTAPLIVNRPGFRGSRTGWVAGVGRQRQFADFGGEHLNGNRALGHDCGQ